ncbi:MAG: aspartate/glutamate racemase family protein [Chloroflexi bacterium]|nr:aspartate/glutamate racemase family protein [Chloroflexota bacterium]
MKYQNRDMGIHTIKARPDRRCYGMGLGIMILDEVYPGFPGDVRNASAYPFPIQYDIVEGVDIQTLVWAEDKSPCLEPIQKAAKRLERMGVRAIAAECGYFAYFQKDIAGTVDVPVFMSSLLQVPFAQQLIGPKRVVGIMAARKQFMSDAHLEAVGIQIGSNYVLAGAEDEYSNPQFENLWNAHTRPAVPTANYEQAEKDFVAACVDFYQRTPNMGAMLLECTGMQPFARAVQREIDIPIFSWGTLLDYAYSVVVHRDYYGHV